MFAERRLSFCQMKARPIDAYSEGLEDTPTFQVRSKVPGCGMKHTACKRDHSIIAITNPINLNPAVSVFRISLKASPQLGDIDS